MVGEWGQMDRRRKLRRPAGWPLRTEDKWGGQKVEMREAGGRGGGGRRQGSRIFHLFTIWLTSAPETLSPAGPTSTSHPPAQRVPALPAPSGPDGTDARLHPRDSEGVAPGVESGFSMFYLLAGGQVDAQGLRPLI